MASSIDPTQKSKYISAWLLCLIFYFVEYAARSAPGVMIPELAANINEPTVAIGALLGAYYYTYSITSLIAGASLDFPGAKFAVPLGLFFLAIGCLLFPNGHSAVAYTARLLQGAGSAFAFTGAVFLATRGFTARVLSTVIGATQCLGMAGGFIGQFAVGPLMHRGMPWQTVWWVLGGASVVLCGGLLFVTPPEATPVNNSGRSIVRPYQVVFSNPQSYLCGAISGLLFVPTTIGAMTWGIALLQHERGIAFEHAVFIASLVPLGWVIGCPTLGWLADTIGRRKPVVIGGSIAMALMLTQAVFLPSPLPIVVTCFVFGVFSGAAMIPYSVMKEVNPDEVKGSATGAINFMTFGVSAVVGPVFGHLAARSLKDPNLLRAFHGTLVFWIGAICIAAVLGFFLRETGSASHASEV